MQNASLVEEKSVKISKNRFLKNSFSLESNAYLKKPRIIL